MNKKEEYFKEILKGNQTRLHSICNYYTRSAEDKNDLFQEIIMNIWKCLDKFRGESSINTWIYRVAINTAITFANKEFKRQSLTIGMDESKATILAEGDSEKEKLKENLLKQLTIELNQLSIIDKAIITLVLEDVSGKEVAEIIGISEANVRVKIYRIKADLKSNLQGVQNDK